MGSSPPNKQASTTEQFNIRWKNYTSVLQSTFCDLLEEERLVDITLSCEGGFIKCHRIILAACSSYFENLLNQLSADGNNGNLVIFIKDLKLWELQSLVHFMYNGEVSVKQNRLAPLVRAAESLHIRGLSTESDDKMKPPLLRGGGGGGGGSRSNNGFEDGSGAEQQDSMPKMAKSIIRRPSSNSIIKSDHQNKTPGQPVKRSSISHEGPSGGSGPFKKIMKTDGTPTQSASSSRPNSASSGSAGGSQFQRPKLINNRSKSATVTEDSSLIRSSATTGNRQKIQSRSNSNEGSEVLDTKEEEDFTGESADVEGDDLIIDEAMYSDDAENTAYYDDDGNAYVDEEENANMGPAFIGEVRGQGGLMIMEPPITNPVVDAADRAERLKKATELALSGITVRQAAAHYAIPRTTLCAYMKRRGYAGKRLAGNFTYQQQEPPENGENYNNSNDQDEEENEFPFLGLADLLKDQPNYEMQKNSC